MPCADRTPAWAPSSMPLTTAARAIHALLRIVPPIGHEEKGCHLELQPNIDINQHRGLCFLEVHPVTHRSDHHPLERPFALAAPVIAPPEVDDLGRPYPFHSHDVKSALDQHAARHAQGLIARDRIVLCLALALGLCRDDAQAEQSYERETRPDDLASGAHGYLLLSDGGRTDDLRGQEPCRLQSRRTGPDRSF